MRLKRGLGWIERSSKRARPHLDLDYARAAWNSISSMVLEDLYDPGKSTLLPYPGLQDPGSRPGMEIDFIGSSELEGFLGEVFQVVNNKTVGFLQLVGPKGFGKSCLLRAGSCVLYKTLPSTTRLICIWSMERCRPSVFTWLKSALLFAYCCDVNEVVSIGALESLSDIKDFFNSREEMGEEFVFIVDGAQKTDVKKWHGSSRGEGDAVAALRADLNSVILGRKVIWGLSPLAEKVQEQVEEANDGIVCYMEGCPKALQKMKDRLITAIAEAPEKLNHDPLATAARKRDVEEYCGIHFLSVCCFETACLQVAVNKGDLGIKEGDAIQLLADEGEWQEVLEAFAQQPNISAIRTSLKRYLGERMKGRCPRICDITSMDPRYALEWAEDEQGRFCTKYLERIYLEFVRKHEGVILKEEGYLPWVSYCRTLLEEPGINWGEMGWLCERVSTMVIARGGVDISGQLMITALASEMFYKIPDLRLVAGGLGCNSGVMFVPWAWNFGRVDAVVIFRDSAAKLHMIGVQFTTNKKRHEHSEDELMSVQVAGQWFPDIVDAVATGELTLHFSFICLGSEKSIFKNGTLKELRRNVHFGVLPHWLHVTLFDEALKNRVTSEVLGCLRSMANRRELDCSDLPVAEPHPPSPSPSSIAAGTLELTPAQLKRISRANLNNLASELGMDPKQYSNIELLRGAMKAAGKIKIVT